MTTLIANISRPQAGEYNPYFDRYISLVNTDDVVGLLERQAPQTVELFQALKDKADYRYAPSRWSVKEMLGHINDTERIMSYRALCIARGDQSPLPGFEQDDYVRHGGFAKRSLADLIEEFSDVRKATLSLLRHMDSEVAARCGTSSNHPMSVRALAYIIAGHELHHRNVLKEKYLEAGVRS